MSRVWALVEAVLGNPITWGVVALVALALALSGRLSMGAAKWIMWAACCSAVFGVYRAELIVKLDPLMRFLVLACCAFGFVASTVAINRWMSTDQVKAQSPQPAPSDTKETIGTKDAVGAEVQLNRPAPQPPKQAPTININTYIAPQEAPYPDGVLIAGIPWRSNYVDVRLDFTVGTESIQTLDARISLDTSIAEMGQLSQFPGIVAFPADQTGAQIGGVWLQGTDQNDKPITLPIVPLQGFSVAPVYRLQCSQLYHDTTLHMVIASVALNPPRPSGGLPQQLFAPVRAPNLIRIVGTFKSEDRATYPINYEKRF